MSLPMARLNWVEIQGFRAFGRELQRVDLPSCVSVLWGPNSQGKTSFAEALEFLLTGTIVRRELLASSQDEFADSLRNAHMAPTASVVVEAEVLGCDGLSHRVKRTLHGDYAKKAPCTSVLEIDGSPVTQEALSTLGIVLSQPPMAAPILMQHTLGYLFTAKPQERSLYFKALLEVGDLDTVRSKIAEREAALTAPESDQLSKLRKCAALPALAPFLQSLLEIKSTAPRVDVVLSNAATALLTAANIDVPITQPERLRSLADLLAAKRSRTFPLQYFDAKALPPWRAPDEKTWSAVEGFIAQSKKIDEQARRLSALFTELLKIPAVAGIDSPMTCPVCETPASLTLERVERIRMELKASLTFRQAEAAAQNALRTIETSVQALSQSVRDACPRFLEAAGRARKNAGFSLTRIRSLHGDKDSIAAWLNHVKRIARSRTATLRAIARAATAVKQQLADLRSSCGLTELHELIAGIDGCWAGFEQAQRSHVAAATPLRDALAGTIDAQSETAGWQDFLDVAGDEAALRDELISFRAREAVKKEFGKALKQIDKAKEQVLNGKFADLSEEIQGWWDRLRPEEPVFFSGVMPRAQAQRTIDFKASLAAGTDRQNVKIRDAIAVFSYSQMHCLGLAAFLARAMREQCGFIVLDDPILSSDEDHRVHFIHDGIKKLTDAGHQVIILTQDQDTSRDLAELYAHQEINCFEILMLDPARGTEIKSTSDSLPAMLARARPFIRNVDPGIRKEAASRLRDAAERFCKEVLVNQERKNGNLTACLTDYGGKNLGQLIPLVEPFLIDASHSGKLKTMARTLNPGKHDDSVPNKEPLVHAHGELTRFQKDYVI